ncbi:efflux transporter outer membrane subunit [Cupriavidus metallidurans]|uniref:efflux transporter outer membrane subunit n=1 Tax=Cupriavidus metallidurans TaxID=119219 RepID=UPI00055CBF15|nr:efflux transporter outer membrane subunit [Cupriavidus metallidurans]
MPFERPTSRTALHAVPHTLAASLLALALSGCAVGPDFNKAEPQAPEDWTAWRSADDSLRSVPATAEALPSDWWRAFGDPVLNRLQQRAFEGSPDLLTAALRFAQARTQRRMVEAQWAPEIDLNGGINRQRLSENGSGVRLLDVLLPSGPFRDQVVSLLAQPFTLYQAGFDLSWEIDLWGRIRRSVEASDADVARDAALLDLARLSLASDVARNYFELRTTQKQIRLLREDISVLSDRLQLLDAQVRGGAINHLSLEQQRAELAAAKAQLPPLLAQESASANQIALLLGERPGALHDELQPLKGEARAALPDLALGLPSELARRRPDIRAAEARLHNATASIGVAQADLYPSIRLGARFGFESFSSSEFADWGSRTWSIGPTLNLPLFDQGRRRSVVQLRELQQQEAAVAFQRTVLLAWHEIDDALSGYAAEQHQARELQSRVEATQQAYQLAQARYDGGAIDFLPVLDSQRSYLQARHDLVASQGRLNTRFVTVNKALGNAPIGSPSQGAEN